MTYACETALTEISNPVVGVLASIKTGANAGKVYKCTVGGATPTWVLIPSLPDVEAWIAPTLLNSWVNFDPGYNFAGYYKDPFGIVHLQGLVKAGTIGATIFTLPAGYRPLKTEIQPTVTSPDIFATARIDSSGNVVAQAGSNTWFSIDGITFRAA